MFHFYIIYRYKCGFSLVKKKKKNHKCTFLKQLIWIKFKKKKKKLICLRTTFIT